MTDKNSGYSHFKVIGRFVIVLAPIVLLAVAIIFKLVNTTVVHGGD